VHVNYIELVAWFSRVEGEPGVGLRRQEIGKCFVEFGNEAAPWAPHLQARSGLLLGLRRLTSDVSVGYNRHCNRHCRIQNTLRHGLVQESITDETLRERLRRILDV
jgi:hypothetical protein